MRARNAHITKTLVGAGRALGRRPDHSGFRVTKLALVEYRIPGYVAELYGASVVEAVQVQALIAGRVVLAIEYVEQFSSGHPVPPLPEPREGLCLHQPIIVFKRSKTSFEQECLTSPQVCAKR